MSGTIIPIGAASVASDATVTTDRWRLRKIEWTPLAASNALIVTDGGGNEILRATATAGGGASNRVVQDYGGNGFDANGIEVTSITASTTVNFHIL